MTDIEVLPSQLPPPQKNFWEKKEIKQPSDIDYLSDSIFYAVSIIASNSN